MISSVFGNLKEVVRLLPVNKLVGTDLKKAVLSTITYVQNHGFKVLCVMTDNNRVNQNMFSHMSDSTFIMNPRYPGEQIFFLYGFVHILKNIRNNWLNRKDFSKTFVL